MRAGCSVLGVRVIYFLIISCEAYWIDASSRFYAVVLYAGWVV